MLRLFALKMIQHEIETIPPKNVTMASPCLCAGILVFKPYRFSPENSVIIIRYSKSAICIPVLACMKVYRFCFGRIVVRRRFLFETLKIQSQCLHIDQAFACALCFCCCCSFPWLLLLWHPSILERILWLFMGSLCCEFFASTFSVFFSLASRICSSKWF